MVAQRHEVEKTELRKKEQIIRARRVLPSRWRVYGQLTARCHEQCAMKYCRHMPRILCKLPAPASFRALSIRTTLAWGGTLCNRVWVPHHQSSVSSSSRKNNRDNLSWNHCATRQYWVQWNRVVQKRPDHTLGYRQQHNDQWTISTRPHG